MSCKCFKKNPEFKAGSSFNERYEKSKCTCGARFCAAENKSKFTILSKDVNEVEKIKIDGYLDVSSEHRKCDYLFVYTNQNSENIKRYIFVELKGEDIDYAVTQIGNVISIFLNNGYVFRDKVIGAVINSRNPSNDGSYRKAKLKLEKTLSSKIKNFRIEKKYRSMIYDPVNDKIL